MAKQYLVSLSDAERETLLTLTRKGAVAARKLTRAHILLQADAGATDDTIAQALHSGTATVERIRTRFVHGGGDDALAERSRPGGKRKLDGKAEATFVAWACSTHPMIASSGRCNCWPTNWLNSSWLRRFRTKPFDVRSKT